MSKPASGSVTMTQKSLSAEELQQLVANVQHVSQSYDPNADAVTSYGQRAAIRGAATQLLHAVTDPHDMSWKQVLHMTELIALRTALRLGVFAAVPVGGSISKSELAQRTNATESLIERQMRTLVGTGFFDQADNGDYKHTKFSESFIDTTQPGPGTFYQAMYDVYLSTTIHFDQYMMDTKSESGQYAEPRSNFHNPFVHYYGQDGQSVWDVMASIPEVMRVFQISLKAVDQILPPVGPFYDFSQFKATGIDDQQIQIVDVGGGYGKVLRDIVAATPELDPGKCVLQDVEGVIGIAGEAKQAGLQTMVIDFHKEQPITGAKAYYLRFISHDYSDGDLHNILTHISTAMSSSSKLLLADNVIPDRLVEATLPGGAMDALMFCIGGKERTETDFREVLGKVGLQLNKIYPVPGSTGAIVEAVKMRTNGVV